MRDSDVVIRSLVFDELAVVVVHVFVSGTIAPEMMAVHVTLVACVGWWRSWLTRFVKFVIAGVFYSFI